MTSLPSKKLRMGSIPPLPNFPLIRRDQLLLKSLKVHEEGYKQNFKVIYWTVLFEMEKVDAFLLKQKDRLFTQFGEIYLLHYKLDLLKRFSGNKKKNFFNWFQWTFLYQNQKNIPN